MYKKWEYIGTKIALKSLLSNWKYRKPPKVWNIMSSRHDELTQHPQVTPSKAPPCSTACATILCLEQANTVRFAMISLFHKDKTLWRFPGRMRCTNIVYRVPQSTRNINVMDGNTDNNRILQNFILHKRFLALLDNSLYRACWPLLFFPHTQYFVQYMSGHRLKPRSGARVERFLQKWDFPVVATMMPRRKGRDLWSPKSTDDVTLNQELFGLHYLNVF